MRALVAVVVTFAVVVLVPGPSAAASKERTVEHAVPFSALLVECTSEPVLILGTAHLVASITVNERRGSFKAKVHTVADGTGAGLVSLAPYTAHGNDHTTVHLDPDAASSEHVVVDMRTGGAAKAQKSHFFIRIKLTISASGNLSADQLDAGCR